MLDDLVPDEYVICPDCGKPIPIAKMNVCYIGRYDCPHCGVSVLIEGDRITAEKDDTKRE
jgi:RNA polymerase-binding transcription factor DksA